MHYQGPQNKQIELSSPRSPKKRVKWLVPILLILIIAAVSGYLLFFKDKGNNQPAGAKTTSSDNSVRLIAVGDNIPHDTINQAAKTLGGYDYKPFFDQVKPFFSKSDIRFCNEETAVGGEELGISGYPTFNAPIEFANDLSATGCNLINIANNHVADKGTAGIAKTREAWDTLKPLGISGANRSADEQNTVSYFEKNGIKFAYVSFSEISNNIQIPEYSLNKFDSALVAKLLGEARKNAEFVIVSAHWGTEDSPEINNAQDLWAKTFADNGADLVIGTGPHVLQPVKKIPTPRGETLAWFSLGNFLSTQLEVNELVSGIAGIDIVKANGKTSIKSVEFLPTYMHYEWTTADKASQDLLKRKNLKIYPLDRAQEPLARSLNNTTVEAQLSYVEKVLNKYMPVTISNSSSF